MPDEGFEADATFRFLFAGVCGILRALCVSPKTI
jgi:hypothetical protein